MARPTEDPLGIRTLWEQVNHTRQYGISDVVEERLHQFNEFVLRKGFPDFAGRYARGDFDVHVHWTFADKTGRHLGNFCAVLSAQVDPRLNPPWTVNRDDEMGDGGDDTEMAVLGDVVQFVKDPQGILPERTPLVVRLQTRDMCQRLTGYPTRNRQSDFVAASFRPVLENREAKDLVVPAEILATVQQGQLPNEMIECGSEIAKEVSEPQGDQDGWFLAQAGDNAVRLRFRLMNDYSHVWATVDVAGDASPSEVQVMFGPADFRKDRLDTPNASHDLPSSPWRA